MMYLNKKGFTLVEVLTVIVVISLIMMISFPALLKIINRNNEELYKSYEKLMVEYAKVSPYKNRNRIYLNELEGLEEIQEKCSVGYVDINHATTPVVYNAYIECGDYKTKNNNVVVQNCDFTYNGKCYQYVGNSSIIVTYPYPEHSTDIITSSLCTDLYGSDAVARDWVFSEEYYLAYLAPCYKCYKPVD